MPRPRKQPLPTLDIPNKINERIANLRRQRGLTQAELANQMGLSREALSNYELGRVHLNEEMIIRFSLALGVSSDELLGLKTSGPDIPNLSLPLMRRMAIIDQFPETKKRHIIRTLDDSIKANRQNDSLGDDH